MILAAENVVDLQFFLMDAAKRGAGSDRGDAACDELLASAAALDYALLLASEHGDEVIDDDSALGVSVRETMTRAASAALDVVERMVGSTTTRSRAFPEDRERARGLFRLIGVLRDAGVAAGDGLAFRSVTLANDLSERWGS